jgi:uncharacterized protein (TIGR00369 family)
MDQRARTYEWGDPREMHKQAQGLTGLEFMRLLASNDLGRTPMMATLAYTFVAVEEGYVEFECEPGEFMYNPIGVVHGGVAATLLDSAASCAVHTVLPVGTAYTTVDLSLHLLRPISSDSGPVRAIGTVLNKGRRTALGNSEVRDSRDRLLAHATAGCLLFPTDS